MNKQKLKDAKNMAADAVLENEDGQKKDFSVVKKIAKIARKVAIAIILLIVGFFLGDKGTEFIDKCFGDKNRSSDSSSANTDFVEVNVVENNNNTEN